MQAVCRGQTLAYVLNQCPTSLHLRHYNIRHDAVLGVIAQGIQPYLPANYSMLADLPSTSSYTFPPHISFTSLRPDLVVWSDADRRVCIVELTICFETRFDLAHNLKMAKYTELIEEARENQYTSNLITVEVESRGPFDLPGFKALLSHITMPSKEWNALLVQITRTVIIESHRIWVMRNWRDPQASNSTILPSRTLPC